VREGACNTCRLFLSFLHATFILGFTGCFLVILATICPHFVMASGLLDCNICPKRPSFSDISHLLTHVGSKGHLSHLHKLQVRSHQEIPAGQQLAEYNDWYQQHDLGQLLSERLMQKEAKAVSRRFTNPRRRTAVKQESAIDPLLARGSKTQKRATTLSRRNANRPMHMTDDDSDFSPTRKPR